MSEYGFPGRTKVCPFCGRWPERKARTSDQSATGMFFVVVCYCGGCVARAWVSGSTIDEVLERWNTRATDKEDR